MTRTRDKDGAIGIVKSYVAPKPSEIDITTGKGFIQDLIARTKKTDIGGLGAQLAYFFLLSFFPMLIFLVTLLPYLSLQQEQVMDFMYDVMPEEVYILIEGTLGEVLSSGSKSLLSFGIIGTIWSASKGVNALMKALNSAYDVEGRPGWKNRILSLVFTFAFIAVILIALVLPIFGQQIGNLVFGYIGVEQAFEPIWNFVRWITPPALILIILVLLYWLVPDTDPRVKFTSVFPGAIFAALGWMLLTFGFSYYINNFGNFSATYGSIGGVIILMLWLYFTGMILIFGGLINATMLKRHQAKQMQKSAKSPVF